MPASVGNRWNSFENGLKIRFLFFGMVLILKFLELGCHGRVTPGQFLDGHVLSLGNRRCFISIPEDVRDEKRE